MTPGAVLDVQRVGKRFGSLAAVDEVSLQVPAGELHAIIGPNGAGKTTFFNLLSGLFAPSAGRIAFEGRDITTLAAQARVALGMGRTFQITEIFPELPVRENLRIAAEVAQGHRLRLRLGGGQRAAVEQAVDRALALTGLAGRADRLAGELPHGDQRATEIGMVLALRPRLLLLDEPTAGMGEQETDAVAQLIERLHDEEGLTIVLIEHDMPVVFRLAERITVLDQGRLLASGTPAEIAANEAVQAAYLGKAT